jgi:protein-S-isoprenylcysteine O-methyltransferase Ste14
MSRLRGLIFTVLVPGVIGACVPALFYRVGELKDGFWRIGWLLAGAGAAIYLMCLVAFLFSSGTPAIFFTRSLKFILGEDPPKLVRQGLYRFSRNPMYVGVVLAVFGQALIFGSRSVVWVWGAPVALFSNRGGVSGRAASAGGARAVV